MKLNVFLITDNIIQDLNELPSIDKHFNWIIIKPGAIYSYSKLCKLIRKYKPVVFCTIDKLGDLASMNSLPYEYRKKWLHFRNLSDCNFNAIESCYFNSIYTNRFSPVEPLFSVISTTFHSGDKIFRPYNSLKSQTYTNWEWILWDDSKEGYNDTWDQLKRFQEEDIRINCYRAINHSGFIGEMKLLSSSLCKGEWIVELDHDDIIDHRLFEWCNEAIKKNPDADFICTSDVELYEDDEKPFSYGDFFGFGYGSYQKEWLRGKWHNVTPPPDITPKTIRYIIGVPNHVRIWRRSFYERIGRHNPDLPVVDDYELLLRSFFDGKWIHIRAPAYFQFRNNGGNNFTFLRNSLIQYLTKKTQEHYEDKIQEFWKNKGIEDDCKGVLSPHIKVWEKSDGYSYNRFIKTYVPKDFVSDKTVSIIITVEDNSPHRILETIDSIVKQTNSDWLLYLIGNQSKTLEYVMEKVTTLYSNDILKKFRWWNLSEKHNRQISLNYAHRMLIVTNWLAYIKVGDIWDTNVLDNMLINIQDKKCWSINGESLYNSIHHFDLLTLEDEFTDDLVKKYF